MTEQPRKAPARQRPRPMAGVVVRETTFEEAAPAAPETTGPPSPPPTPPPDPDRGYAIGYGRPPRHSQFCKGRSGNPCGRPKDGINVPELLQKELSQKLVVTGNNGRPKRISKIEVLITTLANRATKGDAKAVDQVLRLLTVVASARSTNAYENRQEFGSFAPADDSPLPLSRDALQAVARMIADAVPETLAELTGNSDAEPVLEAPHTKASTLKAKPPAASTPAKLPSVPKDEP